MTCHDGFTLNDLVSFNEKHNAAQRRGEPRRGQRQPELELRRRGVLPTTPRSRDLRRKQIKNFLTILFLSQGTPMLLYGDEMRRTAEGDNNTVFQDNSLNWINWENAKANAEILRFTQLIIAFRKRHQIIRRWRYMTADETDTPILRNIIWHGVKPRQADFSAASRFLAWELEAFQTDQRSDVPIYVASNAYWEPITVELPDADGTPLVSRRGHLAPAGGRHRPRGAGRLPARADLRGPAPIHDRAHRALRAGRGHRDLNRCRRTR